MNMKHERKIRVIDTGDDTKLMLRVAVATEGNGIVDASFGQTTLFAVYEVAAEASRLVELVQFAPQPRKCAAANDNPDECEERADARIAAIDTCHLIFARRIGDVAAASAMKHHIHPIAVPRDEPIPALLGRCQTMLATNPPPWLRRLIASDLPTQYGQDGAESGASVRGGTKSVTAGERR